jgi:hypothetical protein
MSSKSGGWDQFSTAIALAIVCLSNEHVAPEVSGPDQPVHSPQITRLATPSPLRPTFEEYEDLDAGFYTSPLRTNEAPNTTDIPAGGAEGHVTHTSMCTLLNRYVKKVDDLEKEITETKAILGGQKNMLTAKVQDLERQLGQKRKRQVVIESEDEQAYVPFGSLHVLADVTLAQSPPPPAPTTAKSLKPQEPIIYHRRQPRSYIGKKSNVSVDAQNLDANSGVPLSEPVLMFFEMIRQVMMLLKPILLMLI